MQTTASGPPTAEGGRMRRNYLRVIVIWLVVLAGLYAFQEVFSAR